MTMNLSMLASNMSSKALDASKANQIKENTETEIKKNLIDTEMQKGKKTAQIDANF
jgi:hypothetical protein